MDEKRLKIEFSDSVMFGFIELSLKKRIERANKLDVNALDQWYLHNTEKYKKYEAQVKEIGLDFYTTKIKGRGSLFFTLMLI